MLFRILQDYDRLSLKLRLLSLFIAKIIPSSTQKISQLRVIEVTFDKSPQYNILFVQMVGQTSTEFEDAIFEPCFLGGPHQTHILYFHILNEQFESSVPK